jgi:uncharacterized protein YjbJ (UPF0337 family)
MMFTVTQAARNAAADRGHVYARPAPLLSIHVEPLTTRNRIMNKKTITGQFNFALGKFQESVGSVLGNVQLQRAAQRRQMDGRIMHAVGEAQDLIKRSLRQRAGSL